MHKDKIKEYKKTFDDIVKYVTDDNNRQIEVWLARDLQKVLGYDRWENFNIAIQRAITSCKTQNINTNDHFRETTKMVSIGSNTSRKIQDFMLTRFACYLIAQNSDAKKEQVAFAQGYFAVQTRKIEIIEERLQNLNRLDAREHLRNSEKQLSKNIYERGVDESGFARIRSKGDWALFGGITTEQMKERLGVKYGALADHLPTLTITAKNLATEMTNYNVEQKDLQGEQPITSEHIQNNSSVRNMLSQRGIKPENLPADEDIKKVQRKVAKENKLLEKDIIKLPDNK